MLECKLMCILKWIAESQSDYKMSPRVGGLNLYWVVMVVVIFYVQLTELFASRNESKIYSITLSMVDFLSKELEMGNKMNNFKNYMNFWKLTSHLFSI